MSILYNGDCLIEMGNIADNSVDCIITDPPYFIHKLGNDWNSDEITKGVSRAGVVGGLPTGVACKLTKRRFIGIEIDEGYYNLAKDRIEGCKYGATKR